MNELMIVDDIERILKERSRERRHLSNIFNHVKQRRHEYKLKNLTLNSHVSTTLKRVEYFNNNVQYDVDSELSDNVENDT